MQPFVLALEHFPHAADGIIIRSNNILEPEALSELRKYHEGKRFTDIYPVGLPFDDLSLDTENSIHDVEVRNFLDVTLERQGERSVILISFG